VSIIRIGSGSEDMRTLETRPVVRSVAHPKYNRITIDYDAGVVKVATPFVKSDIRKPIALVKVGEEAGKGEFAVVSGWGMNRVSRPTPSAPTLCVVQCKSVVQYSANPSLCGPQDRFLSYSLQPSRVEIK